MTMKHALAFGLALVFSSSVFAQDVLDSLTKLKAQHGIAVPAAVSVVVEPVLPKVVPVSQSDDRKLLFSDDFNRDESQETKDELGNGWGTNSKKRAGGNKQVDLKNGALYIYRHETADHGVSVTHPAEFQNGSVELKFMLENEKDSLGLNFADLTCKQVHAGHLFKVLIGTKKVDLVDLKTGSMDLAVRTARKAGSLTNDQKALVKTKTKRIPVKLKTNHWYSATATITGDELSFAIDGKKIGSFSSAGIAHPTKRLLRLAVAKQAVVDDLKIYAHSSQATLTNAKKSAPLKVLLIAGGCCHDYAAQTAILKEGIENKINAEVTVVYNPDTSTKARFKIYESDDWAKGFDVVVHDECSANVGDQPYIERILAAHRKGTPAVNLHCAMHSYRWGDYRNPLEVDAANAAWYEMIGVQSTAHGPKAPIEISFQESNSPITKGLADWTTINEELYNNIRVFSGTDALAAGKQLVKPNKRALRKNPNAQPRTEKAVVVWTNEYGPNKTKIFSTSLGHYNETVQDDRYMELVVRGILWSTGNILPDGKPKASLAR